MADVGRPTVYTEELGDEICERLSDGQSLREICSDPDMPNRSTIYRWTSHVEGFSNQYTRAREEQARALVDDIVDIADNGSNDWMERNQGGNVGWVTNGEALQRSRLRVDTRKWIASKIIPKIYGDKQEIDVNAQVSINLVDSFADPDTE